MWFLKLLEKDNYFKNWVIEFNENNRIKLKYDEFLDDEAELEISYNDEIKAYEFQGSFYLDDEDAIYGSWLKDFLNNEWNLLGEH